MILKNERTGEIVSDNVAIANTFFTRLKGLLGRDSLAEGEALWIRPCNQVHMLGMKFPISVWFLDEDFKILKISDSLTPGRISPKISRAQSVLEFQAGWSLKVKTKPGDRLSIQH